MQKVLFVHFGHLNIFYVLWKQKFKTALKSIILIENIFLKNKQYEITLLESFHRSRRNSLNLIWIGIFEVQIR